MKARVIPLLLILASCDGEPIPELPNFCVSPDECDHLVVAECERADCLDGECVVVADNASNGLPCGGEDACVSKAGVCDRGECVGVERVACAQIECMQGECDTALKRCVYRAATDGTSCEADGNPCTVDTCRAGTCAVGGNECPCGTVADCPALDDLCLGRFECVAAGCVIEPESVVICPADEACRRFECDPQTGACKLLLDDDGTVCGDGGMCSDGAVCRAGVCVDVPRCSDDNDCTDDLCDEATGACSFVQNTSSCDDGDRCTGTGTCAGGSCVADPIGCSDGNDCTLDRCDSSSGCIFTPIAIGHPCQTGDVCLTGQTCDGAGNCDAGVPACDDRNVCTSDSCDPLTGVCEHSLINGPCDDGNDCTVGEYCLSGVCGGGVPIPGCCNFDVDCDDRDACTVTSCSGSRCVSHGQSPTSCPVGLDGCALSWCDAQTGGCGQVQAGMPVPIATWNFTDGTTNQGFLWGEPAGRIVPNGLTASGSEGAGFPLPGRLIPEGVIMTFVRLAAGECADVSFSRNPSASGCFENDGRWAVAAFDSVAGVDDEGRLDVSVQVRSGAVVSHANVFLWSASDCLDSGVRLHDSVVSDLAMAATMGQTAVVFNSGSAIGGSILGDGRTSSFDLVQAPFGVVAGRFGTSVVKTADGFLAAWGAADDRVQVAPLGATGWGTPVSMPVIVNDSEIHAWPALSVSPDGVPVIAMAFGQPDDFDIAIARLDTAGGLNGDNIQFVQVNQIPNGSQINPSVYFQNESGFVVWAHVLIEESIQYKIVGRKTASDGNPISSEFDLTSKAQVMNQPACTATSNHIFCIWHQASGEIGGAILDLETLEVQRQFTFGSALEPNTHASVLPYGDSALVLSIQGIGASAAIVARTVTAEGVVSDPMSVAGPVLAQSTSFAVDRFGPAMFVIAWTDHLGVPGGLRIEPFSPACPAGFVDNNVACTGLGSGRSGGELP